MIIALRIVFGLLTIAALSFGIYFRVNWQNEKSRKRLGRLLLSAAAATFALMMFFSAIEIIPTGYTGVRTTFGQIDPNTMQSGLNWKIPVVQSVEQVNNKQQDIKFDGAVWSETSQRTAIYYENVTVTYRINPERSAWIYANVANYKETLVSEGLVQSAIKSSSKGLSDIDATNRSIIEPLCVEHLQNSLDGKYGENIVMITKVIIGNADFDESYNAAISAKQQAQINAEQQAIENQRAIAKAEADAKVDLTAANAKADVAIIEAKAMAEANRIVEESLTDGVITKMWLEKWDGKVPYYIAGDSTGNLIGIGVPSAAPSATPSTPPTE